MFALCTLVAACSATDDAASSSLREGTLQVESRDARLVDVTASAPIKLGQNELVVTFPSTPTAELVQVSALMPAHGHGSKPPVLERIPQGYRVSNLVLYMSGRWEVRFALRIDGRDDEALVIVDVP